MTPELDHRFPATTRVLAEAFRLLGTPVGLVAIALLGLTQFGFSITLQSMTSDRSAGPGAAMTLGMVSLVGRLAISILRAILHYALARQLGGDDSAELQPPVLGKWIVLAIVVIIAGQIWDVFGSIIVIWLRPSVTLYTISNVLLRSLLGLLIFPIMVRMVSAAHSGNQLRLGAIFRTLWSQRIGWLVIYALFPPAMSLLGWLPRLIGWESSGAISMPLSAYGGLIGGAGTVLSLTFSIAVYRAIHRPGKSSASVFD